MVANFRSNFILSHRNSGKFRHGLFRFAIVYEDFSSEQQANSDEKLT